MKIVYCLNSLMYNGGIERTTISKANALTDIYNHEVYIIVTDHIGDRLIQPLSDKVHLIHLKIDYDSISETSVIM